MELWVYWSILAAIFLSTIVLVWLAIRFKVAHRGLRTLVRMVAGISSLPFALVSLIGLYAQGCQTHTPLIGSPDRKHVARVMAQEGWNEPDWSTVIMRRSWRPTWRTVFFGGGFMGNDHEPIEPQVRWLDNSHLLIESRNTDVEGEPLSCISKVEDVIITCRER
jgi:hypothetical protein